MYAPLPLDPTAPPVTINLFSDTQTRPSRAMREAMLDAEVGDEQLGLDPTVNALCARVAALLGKEAAMFLPSGAMCNSVAILTHCRPGDEIIAHESAHIIEAEGGAPWALAGARVHGLHGARGFFTPDDLRASLRALSRYSAPQTLLEVEQTSNLGGGAIWPLDVLNQLAAIAHEAGMATHMDGARLMNAVVASGIAAADYAAPFDTVWIDFTKGLGAPLGAVLAGSAEVIDRAWRWKQRLGGALRQAGICAAACLYALDHNIDRLAEDHANARRLAAGLAGIAGLQVETPETNLVYADVAASGRSPNDWAASLRAQGIMVSVMGRTRLRLCTHLDVTAGMIEATIAAFATIN
ncbi:threonine aldolase family protein [Acidiphilium acidophilum]|uniref:threonine aldolase family protein n=1 Tax=Acidiphilium acidophilum TaxID=76588 RepID=UPI002E8E741C|nr:threonine aldolase family protein [Acidiphilium acidophilum]